jgi:hypothetical protein
MDHNQEARMFQSHVIEIDGKFVGAAIAYSGKFRFVAVDPRVEELDGTEWGSLGDVQRITRHLLATGSLPRPSHIERSHVSPQMEQAVTDRRAR